MTDHLHGGRIYEYAEKQSSDWSQIEDFSANINPLGPPASVLTELQLAFSMIRHYPDHRHALIKQILAKRFSVTPEMLLCGNGASEALWLLLEELRPSRLVTLTPAFQGYQATARRLGIPVVEIPIFHEGKIELPFAQLLTQCQPGDCLILNNPHNPTGAAWRFSDYEPVLQEFLKHKITVIVDESFMDFLADQEQWSAITKISHHTSLFVVRSATKMYAIPGLRFGFAIGQPDIIYRIEKWRDGWSVNQLAQQAAAVAYQDHEFDKQTWGWLKREHEWLKDTWGNHSQIEVFPTKVNFFLVRLKLKIHTLNLLDKLVKKRIYLRTMTGFSPLDDHYLRIALRSPSANQKLWSEVVDILNDHPHSQDGGHHYNPKS